MARKDNVDLSFMNSAINKNIATKIQNDLDSAYRNTYYSDNKDAKFIDAIRRNVDRDLNGLIDRTRLRYNGHNISDLYSRPQ
jgi:ABC-type Zn uptake system ZnuABC Zn-binding protein ZnuA